MIDFDDLKDHYEKLSKAEQVVFRNEFGKTFFEELQKEVNKEILEEIGYKDQ